MNRDWVVVTGASGGIGREITRSLALKGFPVIMACRNLDKAKKIRKQIIAESRNKEIEMDLLDLSSFRSIFSFAERLCKSGRRIGTLINNAGIMCKDYQTTENAFEMTIGVNYIGTFLLTRLLMPLLLRSGQPDARIINTTSCTYKIGRVNENFFLLNPNHYHRFKAYANSKLAVLLFTAELAERLNGNSISVYAVDPGVVDTDMITMQRWFDPLADLFFRPLIKDAGKAAETFVFLASNENVPDNGILFANCKPKKLSDSVLKHPYRKELWIHTERFLADYIQPFNIP